MHLLALRMSSFLGLKPDAVLKHWACAKILRSKPTTTGTGKDAELTADDEVCRTIVEKFEALGGTDVSYADIAKKAWEVGRGGLATKVCLRGVPPMRMWLNGDSFISSWTTRRKGLIRSPSSLR